MLELKPELILGTAEFGPKPYGEGWSTPLEEREILRILNLAWEAGIETLDTSSSYGCDPLLEKWATMFLKMVKTRDWKKCTGLGSYNCEFYHYETNEARLPVEYASVYTLDQLVGLKGAIVPLSIANTEFCSVFVPEMYVRSVFNRGKLLKEGYTVKDCLDFAKRHDPDGIIVGVNSVKELEEILTVY